MFHTIYAEISKHLMALINAGNNLIAGLIIIAGTVLTISFIYKAYLITSGLMPNPLSATIKDFLVKALILAFAGILAGATINENLNKGLVELSDSLVKVVSNDSRSVFYMIDDTYSEVMSEITDAEGHPHHKSIELFDRFCEFLKHMIIACGFIYFSVICFVLLVIQKVCFYLCIGFSSLFIFFLAFEYTKAWFHSWLNATLGYGLSFAVITFTTKILLETVTKFCFGDIKTDFIVNVKSIVREEPSFIQCLGLLALCIIFAKIIMQISSVVSSWFSSSNQGDAMSGAALGSAMAGARATSSVGLSSATSAASSVGRAVGKTFSRGAKALGTVIKRGK